jgi:hypothetical protein
VQHVSTGQRALEQRAARAAAFFFLRACTLAHAGFLRSLAPFFLSNASKASKTAQGDTSKDQDDAIHSSVVASLTSTTLEPAACPDA